MQPEEPAEKPGAAHAAPTIVVTCSLIGVTALRAEDGALMWMHPTPLTRSVVWPSLISGDGAIYLGAAIPEPASPHQPAQVTALRALDGAPLWQTVLNEAQGPPALAVDGARVFAVGDGGDQAVFALDARTGSVRWMRPNLRDWRRRLIARWNALVRWAALSEYLHLLQDRGTYRLLAAHHGAVYLGASGPRGLHALDARTGSERWRSALRGSPVTVVAGKTHLFTEAYTRQGLLIAALRAADGTVEHTLPIQREREKPLLLTQQGIVYLMRGPELRAVRISDGRLIWRTAQLWEEPGSSGDVAPRAVVSDQTLFYQRVQRASQRLAVGALDRQTGKRLWEWRGEDDLARASAAASLVTGHGRLYVAPSHGLLAFRERDGQLLWRALPKTNLSLVQPALASGEPGG